MPTAETGEGPTSESMPDDVMAVLNGIPGLVGYWGTDLRNRLANDAYRQWFGLGPQQIKGLHMREVLGADVFEGNRPYIEAALRGEEQTFERALVNTNGDTRYVQASYVPSRRDGVVVGFFVLVTDITDRVCAEHQLQESVSQYRTLARNVPGGFVLLFDQDLKILVADGLELVAFGFAREDLEGRTLGEAFPPELAAELEPRYRAALNGEQVSWERAVGRRLFHLTASPVPALDGSVPSAMVLATDITESRRSERTWAALHEIATEVARSDGPQQIAKRIADALCAVFEVDTAAVLKFAAADRAAVLAMSPQHLPGLPQDLVFAPGDKSAVALVATTGRPARVTYEAIDGTVGGQLSKEGLRVGAAAPIFSHGELWGAIALGSRLPDGLDNAVLDRLSRFAELVELAIGQSESRAALEHEATTDDLTGLPNRRAFSDFLDREVELVKRRGWSLSVAIMDLDDFKRINDTFGHPVGDQVLVELANRLIRASREGELIARLGGEEFGWVLPGADGDEAFRAAERVRQVVADSPFDVAGNLTTSIGVSSVGEDYDREALLKRADLALYAAKAEGRNRTTLRQPG